MGRSNVMTLVQISLQTESKEMVTKFVGGIELRSRYLGSQLLLETVFV
jgi:hypothetical protein